MERKSAEQIAEDILRTYAYGFAAELSPAARAYVKDIAQALESYANSRLEEAAQIFESLPPDGGRVKVEVVIESIRSLKSKEPV